MHGATRVSLQLHLVRLPRNLSRLQRKRVKLLPPIQRRFNDIPSMIRTRSEQKIVISHLPLPRPYSSDLGDDSVLKNTTCRAPAICINFTECCACHEMSQSTFSKYCACHKNSHSTFTTYCACHVKCTLLFSTLFSWHLFSLGIYSLLASILSWHLVSLGICSLLASNLYASSLCASSKHLFSTHPFSTHLFSLILKTS